MLSLVLLLVQLESTEPDIPLFITIAKNIRQWGGHRTGPSLGTRSHSEDELAGASLAESRGYFSSGSSVVVSNAFCETSSLSAGLKSFACAAVPVMIVGPPTLMSTIWFAGCFVASDDFSEDRGVIAPIVSTKKPIAKDSSRIYRDIRVQSG